MDKKQFQAFVYKITDHLNANSGPIDTLEGWTKYRPFVQAAIKEMDELCEIYNLENKVK